eukprot:2922418-Prymnesium_polylepis.1
MANSLYETLPLPTSSNTLKILLLSAMDTEMPSSSSVWLNSRNSIMPSPDASFERNKLRAQLRTHTVPDEDRLLRCNIRTFEVAPRTRRHPWRRCSRPACSPAVSARSTSAWTLPMHL